MTNDRLDHLVTQFCEAFAGFDRDSDVALKDVTSVYAKIRMEFSVDDFVSEIDNVIRKGDGEGWQVRDLRIINRLTNRRVFDI